MRYPVAEHTSLYDSSHSFDVPDDVEVPRFLPSPKALHHLNREGYVVLKNVLNASEVVHARELLWSFLEGAGAGVRRDDPATWVRSQPNPYGIVWGHGVGHSRLLWFIRTRPKLLDMFARVWNTSDLVSSFEGFSWLPPTAYEAAWRLGEAWFHTDQNGMSQPGRQTVQSFTSLFDQDATTGAFVVVPRSHKRHRQVTQRVYRAHPATPPTQQFLMLPANDPILASPHRPHLVRVQAGDALLWDSRTVHCSTPALRRALDGKEAARQAAASPQPPHPNRVVVYSSMAPRRRADATTLRARQAALCTRRTCTHWPFLMACLESPRDMGEAPSDPLTSIGPLHKQLVGYTDEQIDAWLHADGAARAREAQLHAAASVVSCPPTSDVDAAHAAVAIFGTPHSVELVASGAGGGGRADVASASGGMKQNKCRRRRTVRANSMLQRLRSWGGQ